jgi:uncharacterized protein YbbK (DUF523 family)
MTSLTAIQALRTPTLSEPLRILFSACLTGITCGYDGTAYGEYPALLKILKSNLVHKVAFCPENESFGTSRELCDIHGGTGLDVINGNAKVMTASGIDWTEGMIQASLKMLDIARKEQIELAIMMDISAACGSQVVYNGNRNAENKQYQIGAGVCAAQLMKNNFLVISQRDFASLEVLYAKIDTTHVIDPTQKDHHETTWYKSYFKL